MITLLLVALFSGVVTLTGAGVGRALAADPMTVAQEIGLGAREHPNILQRYGGEYANPALRDYVAEIGVRLVRTITSTPYEFSFTLLDAADAHAFAMPGGYVYVTRHVLAFANFEAELAAVRAHGISYVISRHARGWQLMQDELRDAPVAENVETMHRFTRDQEFEADTISIRMLAEAGYDPMAQARFLGAIGAQQELAQRAGSPHPRDLASHPAIEARIIRASEFAHDVTRERQIRSANQGLITAYVPLVPANGDWYEGRDRYLTIIHGLVYGRRPSEGITVGNDYIDTSNRYTFTLPPGFRFTSLGRTVTASGPNGGSMRFDVQVFRSPQTKALTT